jgi:hypothetical protein
MVSGLSSTVNRILCLSEHISKLPTATRPGPELSLGTPPPLPRRL